MGYDCRRENRGAEPLEATIESKALAEIILKAALDKKALDPAMLEVTEQVGYTDFFVVVSARNARHVRAVADGVRAVMKNDHGMYPNGTEGLEACRWVLVDFGDVVLHVFQESARAFYDIEGLWGDAIAHEVPQVESDDDDDDEAPLFVLPE